LSITPPLAGLARPAILAATLLALGSGLGSPAFAQAQEPEWAKGRILVMPRAGLSADDLAKVLRPHGGKARRVGASDLHIVDLPPNASEKAVLALLEHHPMLKFAELDQRVAPELVANDPFAGSQWHIPKIGASAAWDVSQGANVTIAILDSGVLSTHADLAARIVPGWNFYDNNSNTADATGHGTSVAGAAAAMTNNGIGVSGVAGSARIMPIRVSDATGYAFYSTIAQGVTYAADKGARVANASFAGVFRSASVQSAAQYLKGKGGLLFVSAGNSNINENAPANSAMIPVAATDSSDRKASFSAYGDYVAMAAPGVGIYTTGRDGGYRSASGTSFSSPITAGVAALMMAAKPSLTAAQVESLLYSTTVDLGTAGRDIYFGHGRVDATAAVAAAFTATAADTSAPTASIASPAGGTTVSGTALVDVNASDNVGVSRVELRVNGVTVATDVAAPYQFGWDSTKLANGTASLVAHAFDAAGNSKASASVAVNVANGVAVDTTPPVVTILNPKASSLVSGMVQISVGASDNQGAAAVRQSLYVNGALVSTATGASLTYGWNTRKLKAGSYTIRATATDAAGNTGSSSVTVTR
jgi:thermitase